MRSLHTTLGISLFFALSSCATKYAPISDHSPTGYAEAQLDSVTWNVGFFANYSTDTVTVNRYVLYRAAELTARHGFDYFVVLDYTRQYEPPRAELQPPPAKVSCPDPMAPKPSIGWDYETSFNTGNRCATVIIRMMHGVYPANDPNAYSARWMLASMGPTIAR